MKKRISFLLAAAMLLSLFTFVSCDAQTVSDAADLVLEIVENLPEETEAATFEQSEPADELQTDQTPIMEETEADNASKTENGIGTESEPAIDENGWYDDKDNVALYIHTYGKLPPNYVSKDDAEALYGWEGGALDEYAEGMAIGGSKFGNYEGLLPKMNGRQYYECDIGTVGTASRGTKRIVYSNDGLIYYTDDHYETFELLYGEE